MSILTKGHIYSFRYDVHHTDLSQLEARQVFGEEHKGKILFSDLVIDPSISPFIKSRFDILLSNSHYSLLIKSIAEQSIEKVGFKVEYLMIEGDDTDYQERLSILRDIGHCILGEPNYDQPTRTYAICNFENVWYFGVLIKQDASWQEHKQKPFKFSNSISMNIAKALVSIAAKGDKSTYLLDACCGVGTIMLEACFAGLSIDGCDINWKACKNTRENLAHFGYTASVFRSDIKDILNNYDGALIDLPYNHTTYSDEGITHNIISSVSRLSARLVIVSISDISDIIAGSKLKVTDYCTVEKRGKSHFTRQIWVCEKVDF